MPESHYHSKQQCDRTEQELHSQQPPTVSDNDEQQPSPLRKDGAFLLLPFCNELESNPQLRTGPIADLDSDFDHVRKQSSNPLKSQWTNIPWVIWEAIISLRR